MVRFFPSPLLLGCVLSVEANHGALWDESTLPGDCGCGAALSRGQVGMLRAGTTPQVNCAGGRCFSCRVVCARCIRRWEIPPQEQHQQQQHGSSASNSSNSTSSSTRTLRYQRSPNSALLPALFHYVRLFLPSPVSSPGHCSWMDWRGYAKRHEMQWLACCSEL